MFRTVTVNTFTYHLLESSLDKNSSFLVSEISNHPVGDWLQTKLFCKTNRNKNDFAPHIESVTMICHINQLTPGARGSKSYTK